MSAQRIDLMPEGCRRRLRRRTRLRQWAAGYAALAAMLVGAGLLVHVSAESRRAEVVDLRRAVDLDADQKRQAEVLEARIMEARQDLDRHARLALPVRASDVVAVIGQVMPASVSLKSLEISPRQERAGARGRGMKSGEPGAPLKKLVIEIEGVAPTDGDMATFVGGLEKHPLFLRVAVNYARKTTLRGREARDFGVTCEIDLGSRYEFGGGVAPASELVGPLPEEE